MTGFDYLLPFIIILRLCCRTTFKTDTALLSKQSETFALEQAVVSEIRFATLKGQVIRFYYYEYSNRMLSAFVASKYAWCNSMKRNN